MAAENSQPTAPVKDEPLTANGLAASVREWSGKLSNLQERDFSKLKPVTDWLTDGSNKPFGEASLPDATVQEISALASMFVGTIPKGRDALKKYLEEKDDSGKPRFEAIKERVINDPKLIVETLATMDPKVFEAALKSDPAIKQNIVGMFKAQAPHLTLSSVFNAQNIDGASADVKAVLGTQLKDIDPAKLKLINTADEIGEFFSYMPRKEVNEFVKKFHESTGTAITFPENPTRQQIQEAITIGLKSYVGGNESSANRDMWFEMFDGTYQQIRNGVQEKINAVKDGTIQMEDGDISAYAINLAKNDPAKLEELLKGPDGKLKTEFHGLITANLLSYADKSLIDRSIKENLADTLNSIKEVMNMLPGGIREIFAGFLKMLPEMLEGLQGVGNSLNLSSLGKGM